MPRSACAIAQADLGLRCPLTESMDILVYVKEQRMLRADCTNANADLDLRCSHMSLRALFPRCVYHMVRQ